jgi:hypothetical protein
MAFAGLYTRADFSVKRKILGLDFPIKPAGDGSRFYFRDINSTGGQASQGSLRLPKNDWIVGCKVVMKFLYVRYYAAWHRAKEKGTEPMLTYIVAFASFLALMVSLYKDRKLEPDTPEVKRALRIHHLAQLLLVGLALWAAIDSDNSNKQHRLALLDAEAATAASRHSTAILDIYFLELLPAGTFIRNHDRYQASLINVPPEMREKLDWRHHVTQGIEDQRIAGLRSFEKLQSIARAVLNEQGQYGERYPNALTKWAARTVEVQETELGDLLSNSDSGEAYARLVGEATGVPRAKYREAVKKLEE